MDNILIIGAGDFQLPLVQRASLSYNVLLAAPVISDAFKPYISDSLLIDVRDKEGILDYAGEHSICGVITDQTDIAVRSVAYVAQELGLPGIGYETGCLFTDKSLMRARMAELGITQAKLAEILGISASRISDYITGKAEPTIRVARDLVLKLEIAPAVVLGL